ncbi:zinc finger protein 77-like [Penaeus monodon]|uniref:zinc finger protein 77-like n=1 Tax=Penaeus monodon TaxID=6687 RepID=UPI0018A7D157|nr:zinc finger protein 77-like [Penaeus monodon]
MVAESCNALKCSFLSHFQKRIGIYHQEDNDQQYQYLRIVEVVSGGRGVTRMRDGHATNVKMHHCPYCPYTTRKKTHMTSHIRVHTREKPFPCPRMNVLDRWRPLQVGLNSEGVRTGRRDTTGMWTGPGQPPRRKIHTCSYCGYSTMYSTGLKRHMRSHTGYKPYACPHCEYSAITKYHLQRHIRIHNVMFIVGYSVEGVRRENIEAARVWMSHAPGRKLHQCSFCDYSTNYSTGLKRHLRTHTGEKPFECSVCLQRFSQKGTLQAHITIHTGEKPFNCPYWLDTVYGKGEPDLEHYSNPAYFSKDRVDTGVGMSRRDALGAKTVPTTRTTHQCPYCPYVTPYTTSLKKHIRTHTKEKPFACSQCPFRTTQPENLRSHFKDYIAFENFEDFSHDCVDIRHPVSAAHLMNSTTRLLFICPYYLSLFCVICSHNSITLISCMMVSHLVQSLLFTPLMAQRHLISAASIFFT